jgi:hypothetical protein
MQHIAVVSTAAPSNFFLIHFPPHLTFPSIIMTYAKAKQGSNEDKYLSNLQIKLQITDESFVTNLSNGLGYKFYNSFQISKIILSANLM